jgi:hypothetical protein
MVKRGYQKKLKKDGKPNPKYVDMLEVDKPIAGQNWGCFSFVSPEKILKQKELYFFEEFLKQWEMNKSMEKFSEFLNYISDKYKLNHSEITTEFETFVKEERELIVSSSVENDYKNFLDRNEEYLENKFNSAHNFQTSVRGFKARGNFATEEEARLRAKLLRECDPSFDIYVGPIGTWVPWDPDAYKTGEVEYMEEKLNELVSRKKENEEIAKNAFEQRVKDAKQQAIENNKANAEKYGNVVTQDIDEEGNLIGTKYNTIEKTFSQKEPETISVADIRRELFEGDDIVTGKSDYGQSLLKSGPFASKSDV